MTELTHLENDASVRRRCYRAVLRPRGNRITRIEIIPGIALAPRVFGEHGHYEKKSNGEWVSKAYMRKGWSSAHYVRSTMRIQVGLNWLHFVGVA